MSNPLSQDRVRLSAIFLTLLGACQARKGDDAPFPVTGSPDRSCPGGELVEIGTAGQTAVCVPPGWRVEQTANLGSARRLVSSSGAMVIFEELRQTPDEARSRLHDIEVETPAAYTDLSARYGTVQGWPTLFKRYEGPILDKKGRDRGTASNLETAVAHRGRVLRFHAVLTGPGAKGQADLLETGLGDWLRLGPGDEARSAERIAGLRRSARFVDKSPVSSGLKRPADPRDGEPGGLMLEGNKPRLALENASEATSSPGVNILANGSNTGYDSEIHVAASADGRVVVVANNGSELTISNNGGTTFAAPNNYVPGMPFQGQTNGDPDLTVGRSGTFYLSHIGFPGSSVIFNLTPCLNLMDPNCHTISNELASATQATLAGGGTFTYVAPIVVSPRVTTPGGAACFFPDQPHTVADRATFSTVLDAAGNVTQDLLYSAFRNFVPIPNTNNGLCINTLVGGQRAPCQLNTCPGAGCACTAMGDTCVQSCLGNGSAITEQNAVLTCSANSGQTWPVQRQLPNGSSYARLAVSSSGAVYVVYRSGANGAGNIMIDKYGSCDGRVAPAGMMGGLLQFPGFPIVVSTTPNIAGGVNCPAAPIAGIDRCNNGSELSSPTVTVEPGPTGGPADDIVYVAFATTNTGAGGGENITVMASRAGGTDFNTGTITSTTVNAGGAGRRFMPWICSTNGQAYVSWYDMRNATMAAPDLADYFARGLTINAAGAFTLGNELRLSANSDPLCQVGWSTPGGGFTGTRCPGCSNACPTAAQRLAGSCWDTGVPCDFSLCTTATTAGCQCGQNPTPAGTPRCQVGGGGPKYGDYNANTCVAGRVYSAWASSTGAGGALADIDAFFACPQDPGMLNVNFAADVTPPVVLPAAPQTNASDCVVSDAAIGAPTAYDRCGPTAPTPPTRMPAGNTFPPGITTLTWTSTDGAGNPGTATQVVNVVDSTGPVVTAPPPLFPTNCGPVNVDAVRATAVDGCSGAVPDAQISHNAPMVFGAGLNQVTWTALDSAGNPGTAIQNVDVSPPTFGLEVNSYVGSQWWGTIRFRNTSSVPTSNYQVEFDVPAGKHCTAEPESVPPGAVLSPLTPTGNPRRTVSNHCVFTWTNAPPLQPNTTKTFNYSTDHNQNFTAAGVNITDTLCSCVLESDAAFCARNNKNCGTFSGTDNCTFPRTANCGTCPSPLQCDVGGPNVCGVSQTAVADSYVREGVHAASNFGSELSLGVKLQTGSNNTRRTYLRFDISGLPTIGKATLRLFGNRPEGTNPVAAFAVSNTTWGEGTITWNNKPGTGAKQNGNVTISTTLKWYEFDVTSWVKSQQMMGASQVSLAVISQQENSDPPSTFQSKEAPSNPPQLVLTQQ